MKKITQEQLIRLCQILCRQTVGVIRTDTVQDWMEFNRTWRKFEKASIDRFPAAVRCTVPADLALRLMSFVVLGSVNAGEIDFMLELKDLAADPVRR